MRLIEKVFVNLTISVIGLHKDSIQCNTLESAKKYSTFVVTIIVLLF